MAYNYPTNPSPLKVLLPGWEFSADNGEGWRLVCPFKHNDSKEELKIPLLDPSELYHGRLDYPLDLLQLIELRERVIIELVNYTLPETLEEKPKLKETLLNNILFST